MVTSARPLRTPCISGLVFTLSLWLGGTPCLPAESAVARPGEVRQDAAGRAPSERSRFSVEQQGGTFWLVKPSGERFFSLGVCCVNQGASKEAWDAANPGYAAWRYYPQSNAWAVATLERLRSWGFTTVGGWSDFEALKSGAETNLVFAPVLHIGASAGAPWWDMWDPKVVARLDEIARQNIVPLRDDPRVIGYYTDNEIGWWNAILFNMTLQQAPTSGQRQRLLQLLRETYRNDWSALMQDFETSPILESWEELERHGMLHLRPGGNGLPVARQFLGLLAERYYSLVHDIVRKHDPRALLLGDRYPSFYYPEVIRASRPYLDVRVGVARPAFRQTPAGKRGCPRVQLDLSHPWPRVSH